MKLTFLIISIILCLVLNESMISWLLAVFVGNYEVNDGFKRAFQYFTLNGYVFSLSFRAIPFIILLFLPNILQGKLHNYINVISWFWLIGITFFITYGYWSAQHSLYTDSKTSSTYAIDFIVIPILAVAAGLISGGIGFLCAKIYREIRLRI